MQETRVRSLGQEDLLEKEMASHLSTIAWKIPWTQDPGRLHYMGRKESDTTKRRQSYVLYPENTRTRQLWPLPRTQRTQSRDHEGMMRAKEEVQKQSAQGGTEGPGRAVKGLGTMGC